MLGEYESGSAEVILMHTAWHNGGGGVDNQCYDDSCRLVTAFTEVSKRMHILISHF